MPLACRLPPLMPQLIPSPLWPFHALWSLKSHSAGFMLDSARCFETQRPWRLGWELCLTARVTIRSSNHQRCGSWLPKAWARVARCGISSIVDQRSSSQQQLRRNQFTTLEPRARQDSVSGLVTSSMHRGRCSLMLRSISISLEELSFPRPRSPESHLWP